MSMVARVLVTEDDDAVRGVIVRVLGQHGYAVVEARSVSDALAQWRETTAHAPIDLLITDLMMPGGTGRELADALWAMAPQLPVLFMSGYEEDVTVTALQRPVVHLTKPFKTTQLLGHVEDLLRMRDTRPAAGGG